MVTVLAQSKFIKVAINVKYNLLQTHTYIYIFKNVSMVYLEQPQF